MTEQINNKSIKEFAADFIEGFLDIAQYNGDIEVEEINERPFVKIITDEDDQDIKDLVGKDGVVLLALEKISSLVVRNKTDKDVFISLDIAGYKQTISEKYLDETRQAIQTVLTNQTEIKMRPANSYNRRLIHHLVAENGLSSRSEGAEPFRYVIISPQTAHQVPA